MWSPGSEEEVESRSMDQREEGWYWILCLRDGGLELDPWYSKSFVSCLCGEGSQGCRLEVNIQNERLTLLGLGLSCPPLL